LKEIRKYRTILVFILLGPGVILLQPWNDLAAQDIIGKWKSHLSFTGAVEIADAGDRIYCATGSGLFYYHKTDHTIRILTKVEGLSDQEISGIAYDSMRGLLVVAYQNTNVDLVGKNEIHNIPDILRKQLTGNKTIHGVKIIGDDAYLSCGFGIVVLNLEKKEIRDTYYIGENGRQGNVYDTESDGNWLYAATDGGVYRADINSPNLIDFNNWTRMLDLPYPTRTYNALAWFGGRLYAGMRNITGAADSLYYQDAGVWKTFTTMEASRIYHLGVSNGRLLVITRHRVALYNTDNSEVQNQYMGDPNHAYQDQDGILWIADRRAGMIKSPNPWVPADTLCPNGPLSNDIVSIAISGEKIYTVAGSVTSGFSNQFNQAELNILDAGIWEGTVTVAYRDPIHVSVDPGNDEHVFAATWGYGLMEYINGQLVQVYDEENSTLQSIIPGDELHRLGGSVFDNNRNLWVTNSAVAEPISVLKADGQWRSYELEGKLNVNALGRIIFTRDQHLWVQCHQGHGLFALDVNGTPDDLSDDSYEKFDVKDVNGKTISNYVHSLVEDKNGNIWVGTDKGIVVYYSPSRVFSGDNFYGQQVIVPRNDGTGLADVLLQNETVTTIAVDGANRKWIGTSKGGVFLLSDDGLEQIHHFTVDNSPLLSNNILDIAVDGKTGTVYLGTDKGLVSYKGTAIEGKEFFSDVYVYPNPVREDFTGEIVITGLVADVNVKITDISGNIVFETTSLGGQAIWDGKSFSGNRVSTGVYLVFCTSEDGSMTHTTKLLVIN